MRILKKIDIYIGLIFHFNIIIIFINLEFILCAWRKIYTNMRSQKQWTKRERTLVTVN